MAGLSAGIETAKLDVMQEEDVDRVVKLIVEQAGKIDVLVNNAGAASIGEKLPSIIFSQSSGLYISGPILDAPVEKVRDTFELNTFSALRVAKAVFPSMAARKSGLIVNIGSIVGEVYVLTYPALLLFILTGNANRSATPWNGLYSASKAALHMITDVLDMECRPFNVRVMLISPGGIRSNISANQASRLVLPDDTLYKKYLPNIIARMHASQTPNSMPAEEFARRVVYAALSREPPRYMTLGENSLMIAILRWLPRTFVLWTIWRRFSRPVKT